MILSTATIKQYKSRVVTGLAIITKLEKLKENEQFEWKQVAQIDIDLLNLSIRVEKILFENEQINNTALSDQYEEFIKKNPVPEAQPKFTIKGFMLTRDRGVALIAKLRVAVDNKKFEWKQVDINQLKLSIHAEKFLFDKNQIDNTELSSQYEAFIEQNPLPEVASRQSNMLVTAETALKDSSFQDETLIKEDPRPEVTNSQPNGSSPAVTRQNMQTGVEITSQTGTRSKQKDTEATGIDNTFFSSDKRNRKPGPQTTFYDVFIAFSAKIPKLQNKISVLDQKIQELTRRLNLDRHYYPKQEDKYPKQEDKKAAQETLGALIAQSTSYTQTKNYLTSITDHLNNALPQNGEITPEFYAQARVILKKAAKPLMSLLKHAGFLNSILDKFVDLCNFFKLETVAYYASPNTKRKLIDLINAVSPDEPEDKKLQKR